MNNIIFLFSKQSHSYQIMLYIRVHVRYRYILIIIVLLKKEFLMTLYHSISLIHVILIVRVRRKKFHIQLPF